MRKYILFTSMALLFLFTGCSKQVTLETVNPSENYFIKSNYQAANHLLDLTKSRLPIGSSVIMATVVNIDMIEKSSTLGRAVSDQITTRFVQSGMNMIEIKFRDNIYVKQNEGELALTREIEKIAKNHNANAVIVGTYAISDKSVFVNLRIIDPTTNIAIAATDYVLPLNNDMKTMLGIAISKSNFE